MSTVQGLLKKDKKRWKTFVFGCILLLGSSVLSGVGMSLILGMMENESQVLNQGRFYIGLAIVFLPVILMFVSSRIEIPFIESKMIEIREYVFDRIISLNYASFRKESKNYYLSILTNDLNTFEEQYFSALKSLIINKGVILTIIFLVFLLDFLLLFYVVLFVVVIYVVTKLFHDKVIQLNQEISDLNVQYTSRVSNIFQGEDIIKTNNSEEYFLNRIDMLTNNIKKKKKTFSFIKQVQDIISQRTGTISFVLILLYIANEMVIGYMDFTVAVILIFMVNMLSQNVVEYFPNKTKLEAAENLLNQRIDYIFSDLKEKNIVEVEHKKFSFDQQISFDNVSFSHDKGEKILKEIKIIIEKGKKYLVTGPSGSGKSTFLNLLSRNYEEYNGTILIDNEPYSDIQFDDFYMNVSMIYQDVFLFEDTIYNNICLYNEYTLEEVELSVQHAGLNDFITSLPNGLETMITENGKELSGGEKQRIAIARGIIKNSKLVIADEITSNLDKKIALKLEHTLLSLDTTVVNVSHRVYEENSELYDYYIRVRDGFVTLEKNEMKAVV